MGMDLPEFSIQTAKEMRKAWELFIAGNDKYLDKVRPEIRESWRRSRYAKVDPLRQKIPTVLDPEELHDRCKQNLHLLEAGRKTIAHLSLVLSAAAFLATITDREGHILYNYFPPHKGDRRRDINALPGGGIQESLIGTTPAGAALYLNRPFRAYWYENYLEIAHCWAGCAAPIHNPCGDTIGALSIVGYREVAHPLAFEIVACAAQSIDEQIRYCQEVANFAVVKEFNRYLLKFSDTPIVALDPQGNILALSPAVAKVVEMQPPERLIGRHLHQVQDFRFEALFPLPTTESLEPYETTVVVQAQERSCAATVIPVSSREGQRAGLVVIAPDLSRPTPRKVTKPLWQAKHTFHAFVGHAPAFSRAVQLAQKAAEHDRPVLLIGESGTGKELFAQAIHRASGRTFGPFVAVNCGTIPKELAAAELFGYEEGAFSGARRGGQQGKVPLAHGGTLFLDEVGDMPAEIQVSFLRVLEEGEVVPLGSKHPRPVDVRVIAALNEHPATAVAHGKLRLDLCHRLNVFPIPLPPLRERLEDLSVLVRHLLEREGFPEVEIAPEVMELFRRYPWPGNVRELRNMLVRAAMLCPNRIITREQLLPELLTSKPTAQGHPQRETTNPSIPSLQQGGVTTGGNPASRSAAQRIDQALILHALEECGGNVAQAARCLGIHRVTLYRKLRQHDPHKQGDLSQRLKKLTAHHCQNEQQELESSDLASLIVRAVFQYTGASIASVSSITSIPSVTGETLQADDTKRWSLKTAEIAQAAQRLAWEKKGLAIDPAWLTSKRVGRVLARLQLRKDPDTSTRAWQVNSGELARLAVALGLTP